MSTLSQFFPTGSTPDLNADAFADVIVVAGGGGAATNNSLSAPYWPTTLPSAGGGGGGIYVFKIGLFCGNTYPVTVGGGGAAGPSTVYGGGTGSNGSNSAFWGNRFYAIGGGGSGSLLARNPCGPYQPGGLHEIFPGRPGGQGGSAIRVMKSSTHPCLGVHWSYSTGSSTSFATRCGFHYGDALNYSVDNPTYNNSILTAANGLNLGINQCCAPCGVSMHGGSYGDGCCVSLPIPCYMRPNTGNGGSSCTNCSASCAGNSGFVVVSYPNQVRAAPSFPGAVDCSPQTPRFRTYLFTSSGSITI